MGKEKASGDDEGKPGTLLLGKGDCVRNTGSLQTEELLPLLSLTLPPCYFLKCDILLMGI
jgi:hypothetical protein